MRCLYYNNFQLQGLPSLRSLDAQPALPVGNPQFRSGQYWNRSKGHGIEIAEGTTNFVVDGNFNKLDNWADKGTPTTKELTGLRSVFGSLCCHIVADANDEGIQQSKNLSGSTQYTVSAYVYANSGNMDIGYWDGTTMHAIRLEAADPHKKWVRLTKTFTTAASVSGGYFTAMIADGGGGELWVDGFQCEQKGYATPFDSVNVDGATARSAQYLKIPTAGNFPGMDGGSILISLRPDWGNDYSQNPLLWSQYVDGSNEWHLIYLESSDKFRFHMTDGTSTNILSGAQSFARGDKILVVITWDGNNGELYVNGVVAGAQTKTQRIIKLREAFIVGANQNGFTGQINGVIDEFAIFNQAMTQRMVNHIYNNLFSKGKTLLGAGFKF